MKTIKTLLVSSLSLLLFSCGEPKTPSEIALKSTECMMQGDIEDTLDYFNINDEEKAKMLTKYNEEMKPMIEKEQEKIGKPIKFEVISETISEDGNKAVAEIHVTFEKMENKPHKRKIFLSKVNDKWFLDL